MGPAVGARPRGMSEHERINPAEAMQDGEPEDEGRRRDGD